MADLLDTMVTIPIGPEKDRVFTHTDNAKFENSIGLPNELTFDSKHLNLTVLCYGEMYKATKTEIKSARNTMRRAGVPPFDPTDSGWPLFDTLVVEVAATMENGFVCAVRFFGMRSTHNRWEDDKKIVTGIIKCVNRGCYQIKELIETEMKWVKTVIFQTDSDDIMQGVTKIWDWVDHGFPTTMSTGVAEIDYLTLNQAIESLEAVNGGTKVLFWKVDSQYLNGAYHQVECQQSGVHGRCMQLPAASCGHCTKKVQLQELGFARNGLTPLGNAHPHLAKMYGHLKKGDSFPLSNCAGVDAKVVMEVDGSVGMDAVKNMSKKDIKAMEARDPRTAKLRAEMDCGQ